MPYLHRLTAAAMLTLGSLSCFRSAHAETSLNDPVSMRTMYHIPSDKLPDGYRIDKVVLTDEENGIRETYHLERPLVNQLGYTFLGISLAGGAGWVIDQVARNMARAFLSSDSHGGDHPAVESIGLGAGLAFTTLYSAAWIYEAPQDRLTLPMAGVHTAEELRQRHLKPSYSSLVTVSLNPSADTSLPEASIQQHNPTLRYQLITLMCSRATAEKLGYKPAQ